MIAVLVHEFRPRHEAVRSAVLAVLSEHQARTGMPMTGVSIARTVTTMHPAWDWHVVLGVVANMVDANEVLVAQEGPIAWLALPCDQGRAFNEFERLTSQPYRVLWRLLREQGASALDVFRVLGYPGVYRENLAEAIVARRFSPAWCW